MPKGTKVHKIYDKLKGKLGKSSAAKIAQAQTGRSLMTGEKIKKRGSK